MREQVTAAILEAAEDVLAARGLEGASTAAIAERAGVAVGTLYNYFPDREALFASLFKQRRAEIRPRLDEVAQASARLPIEKRLREYLAGVMAIFEDRRTFIRVVVAVDQKETKPTSPVLLTTVVDALVAILRPTFGKRADDYAVMIVGAIKLLVRRRVEDGEPFAPDADLVADTFLQGMSRR